MRMRQVVSIDNDALESQLGDFQISKTDIDKSRAFIKDTLTHRYCAECNNSSGEGSDTITLEFPAGGGLRAIISETIVDGVLHLRFVGFKPMGVQMEKKNSLRPFVEDGKTYFWINGVKTEVHGIPVMTAARIEELFVSLPSLRKVVEAECPVFDMTVHITNDPDPEPIIVVDDPYTLKDSITDEDLDKAQKWIEETLRHRFDKKEKT